MPFTDIFTILIRKAEMKYKMIVADCDDTILNGDYGYSGEFKKSVERYTAAGGKFVIATGRTTGSVLPYCYDLGLHGEVISYQGAVTSDIDTGEILDFSEIGYLDAAEIAEYIEKQGHYFHIYEGKYFVAEKETPYSIRYGRHCGVEFKAAGEPLSKYIASNAIRPLKMMILADEDKIYGLLKELREEFKGRFIFNTSKRWMIEIVPATVSKGLAVCKLALKYGIKREEVICVGDSQNDISMIEYAGLGVVMENGSLEAKAAADVIAPSNNDDGVNYIINKYGFLK